MRACFLVTVAVGLIYLTSFSQGASIKSTSEKRQRDEDLENITLLEKKLESLKRKYKSKNENLKSIEQKVEKKENEAVKKLSFSGHNEQGDIDRIISRISAKYSNEKFQESKSTRGMNRKPFSGSFWTNNDLSDGEYESNQSGNVNPLATTREYYEKMSNEDRRASSYANLYKQPLYSENKITAVIRSSSGAAMLMSESTRIEPTNSEKYYRSFKDKYFPDEDEEHDEYYDEDGEYDEYYDEDGEYDEYYDEYDHREEAYEENKYGDSYKEGSYQMSDSDYKNRRLLFELAKKQADPRAAYESQKKLARRTGGRSSSSDFSLFLD